MKKKIFLTFLLVAILACVFAVSICAASVTVDEITYNLKDGATEVQNTATIDSHKGTTFKNTVKTIPAYVEYEGEKYYVTDISDTALESTNLTEVYFDKDCQIKIIRSWSFKNCTSLKTIVLPSQLEEIKAQAFFQCSNLTALYLPDTVRAIGYQENGDPGKNYSKEKCGAFYGCSKLYFVNSVGETEKPTIWYAPTALEKISGETLKELSALNSIMVFDENFIRLENGFALANKNTSNPITMIFKGDFTKAGAIFEISCELKNREFYFTHPNVWDTSIFSYSDSYTSNTPDANIHFCSTETSFTMKGMENGGKSLKFIPLDIKFTHLIEKEASSIESDNLCTTICDICYCGKKIVSDTSLPAVFTFRGYSTRINGNRICVSYDLNIDAYKKYVETYGELNFGMVFGVPDEAGEVELLNPDGTGAIENAIGVPLDMESITYDFVVNDFDWEKGHCDLPIALYAYVSDGSSVDYLCANDGNLIRTEKAPTFTMNEMAELMLENYEVRFSCDSNMGEIIGEAKQTVREGKATTEVTAKAKDGYTFVCWNDGTKDATITVTPDADTQVYAYFSPSSTGLPVFSINTEGGVNITTKEYYINCEITLLDTETGNNLAGAIAEIKGRGNSTWNTFTKKPYKFKFDKKQNLFGYGNEKTWVLLADAKDYSLIRNMLALNAGLSLSELDSTSKGQSVELYLNGVYKGVYYLCEQIQVKENRVNIAEEEEGIKPEDVGYLIEMDAWAADSSNKYLDNCTKEGDVFVKINGGQRPFVIKDPEDVFLDDDGNFDAEKAKPYLDYIQGYLQKVHDAITSKDYARICELIDVKSFAQAYIIFEWFNNPDTDYSSVYFYKDADILNEDGTYTYSKLVCDPLWDFDMSIGNVSHRNNEGNFTSNEELWTANKNTWFKNLLSIDEFRNLVAQELVDNEATLKASIADTIAYARAHADAYKKNFTVWTDLIGNLNASNQQGGWSVPNYLRELKTWEDHLVYIENYLEEAYAYLKTQYPVPSVSE